MKYIYGPVQSRRLGLSLGVSLTPHKTCNFDCVYCQLGSTKKKVSERSELVRIEEIIAELKSWLASNTKESKLLDYVTLCGMGEPTLHTGIAEVIKEIKKSTAAKISVITNSSFLSDASLRQAIKNVDLIVPSLDAADEITFQKIDRPALNIHLEGIINGLINLRKEFSGNIWLEVMLVKGINDSFEHIKKLKEIINRINPDKIQLNSPVRTTAEQGVLSVDKDRLEKFKEILGEKCEIF